MVFSSLLFLCIFLPIVLLLYFWNSNITYRNTVMVIASLIFYAWGEPVWVIALLFSAAIDYVNGLIIHKYFGKWQAKLALIMSLVLNLGILATFKYSSWIISSINTGFGLSIPYYKLCFAARYFFLYFPNPVLYYRHVQRRNRGSEKSVKFPLLCFDVPPACCWSYCQIYRY